MQDTTAAWAEETPDIPWTTPEGLGWRALHDQAAGILASMRHALHAGSPAELVLAVDHLAEAVPLLRDLDQAELPVRAIYAAGARDALRAVPRRHLRLALIP